MSALDARNTFLFVSINEYIRMNPFFLLTCYLRLLTLSAIVRSSIIKQREN